MRILLVVLVPLLLPAPAFAGACNEEIVARIAMPAGRTCWAYRGSATTFVGEFGEGQRIVARMRGEAAENDPATGRVRVSMQNREPYASGPAKFSFDGADGNLAFTTPAPGLYRFGFSPCAMWGAPGIVEICAR